MFLLFIRRVLCSTLFLLLASDVLNAAINPQKVVVLANANSADSLEVARYYMHKREIPDRNLIILPMSLEEEIDWPTFVSEIHNPLLDQLVRMGWISADRSNRVDMAKRNTYALYGSSVDFLVVCKDVPLKIRDDQSLIPERSSKRLPPQYLVANAAVDAELSLLPYPRSGIVALVENPLYQKLNPGRFTLSQILRVSRLDGPSLRDVTGMIDNALIAEKRGLMGRAYIDYGRLSESEYNLGNIWLDETQKVVSKMGYAESVNRENALFGWSERFDAPALYFGWHSESISGPLSDPSFRFPPGALAMQMHSYSASTVRSTSRNWVGPLVSRGVTGTVGNVYEPYLGYLHHPNLFIEALEAGKAFGEAAYYAQPALSWHTIVIGDPLYVPFKVSLAEQLKHAAEAGYIPYAQYSIIRKMRLMRDAGNLREASDFGVKFFTKQPGMALYYEVAMYYWELGDRAKTYQILNGLRGMDEFNVEEQGLALEIARFLHQNGAREMALVLYEKLLNDPALNETIAKIILPDAVTLAIALDRMELANMWQQYMKENGINP